MRNDLHDQIQSDSVHFVGDIQVIFLRVVLLIHYDVSLHHPYSLQCYAAPK